MPRPPRHADPELFWHVNTRGNKGLFICRSTREFDEVLRRLGLTCERYGLTCHAYCVMGTHYHALLELREPNLPLAMHWLNSGYAHSFNRRYGSKGHVFEQRYHSEPVATEAHLLTSARYIELNPVRAGIVRHPADWPWSSYRAHVGLALAPPFLSHLVLDVLTPRRAEGREAWRAYVESELRRTA